MEYFVNCNTATLAPYASPLDKTRVEHLFRRLGFSASVNTIDQAVGQSANALVDVKPEALQQLGDALRGANFFEAEFGMTVEIAAPGGHLIVQAAGTEVAVSHVHVHCLV